MIVLDTTVLSYAVGTEHPLRAPCRRLLQAHGNGLVEAATTVARLFRNLRMYAPSGGPARTPSHWPATTQQLSSCWSHPPRISTSA